MGKGVQSWDCSSFHPNCKNVIPMDIGGFAYLWCPDCRVLSNLQAISPKHEDWDKAKKEKIRG